MNIGQFTHRGLVRELNEDTVWADPETGLFVVADGMGGHLAGEVASAEAVRLIRKHLSLHGLSQESVREAFLVANREILRMSRTDESLQGMGTTVSLAALAGLTLVWGHVGDSRIYLLRDGGIRQITRDHTMVEELVTQGAISPEEARVHPRKNVLIRALGTEDSLLVDVGTEPLLPGDLLLLMSDGVYSYLDDGELTLQMDTPDLEQAAEQLKQYILDRGAQDNLSFVAVRIGDNGHE